TPTVTEAVAVPQRPVAVPANVCAATMAVDRLPIGGKFEPIPTIETFAVGSDEVHVIVIGELGHAELVDVVIDNVGGTHEPCLADLRFGAALTSRAKHSTPTATGRRSILDPPQFLEMTPKC